jgi:hypothetical protein
MMGPGSWDLRSARGGGAERSGAPAWAP